MSKTFIGIVTFGGLNFTKLAYKSILDTVKSDVRVCIIVGKPGDGNTASWASANNLPHIVHNRNYGFPYSLNDLYDWGFGYWKYDYFVAMGNDVIAYPHAIDSLISAADSTNYDWLCAREFDVRSLVKNYPHTRKYFDGGDLKFNSFGETPWLQPEMNFSPKIQISKAGMSDTHNLALYKKHFFDLVGYNDVNFYPAYYEDNDLARRSVLLNVQSCTIMNSIYFHFWSRTLKQESGGSNNRFFEANRNYYKAKWGGDFGHETFALPYNGKNYPLNSKVILEPKIKISSREQEKDIIDYWSGNR